MSLVPRASLLERSGHLAEALHSLRHAIRSGDGMDAEIWHTLGRLHQRLGNLSEAYRAYSVALLADPHQPRSCNNLALLELGRLDADEAERWLMCGLALQPLKLEDEELLQATACDLRLFQLRPDLALNHAEQQISRRQSVIALANRAVCLHKLGRLREAVLAQERAIQMHVAKHAPSLIHAAFVDLIGLYCGDSESSIQLQIQLVNLAIYRLCLDIYDSVGLRLMLAGTCKDPEHWKDPRLGQNRWDGSFCDLLILWDDQGFGDTIQNLSWLSDAASRVGTLKIRLRKSLLPLVKSSLPLPVNCTLEALDSASPPWEPGSSQAGLFFLPIILDKWKPEEVTRSSYLKVSKVVKDQPFLDPFIGSRIGLVWSAGRHQAPQPERSARVRDVPKQPFFELVRKWKDSYEVSLSSMQLEGHDEQPVLGLLQAGLLDQPLTSPDWLQTAKVLQSLDLLVSVDTSVAHLAGALGVPTILMLSAPADWRWSQVGCQTFLYDSFTLVRCASPGDWTQVLQQTDRVVSEWLSSRTVNV